MERRKTPSFDEQVAKKSYKKPEPYNPKGPVGQKSPYSDLEVETASITIHYKYKKGHQGSRDFKSIQGLKDFLLANENILKFVQKLK